MKALNIFEAFIETRHPMFFEYKIGVNAVQGTGICHSYECDGCNATRICEYTQNDHIFSAEVMKIIQEKYPEYFL